MRTSPWALLLVCLALSPATDAAEEWEEILKRSLVSKYSQTRHDGLKAVDTTTKKGLAALWNVLENSDPDKVDWFVRKGAQEALWKAEGPEAETEIERLLQGSKKSLSKETVIYSIIERIRRDFVNEHGGNDDDRRNEATHMIRKTRGLDYFALVLPTIEKVDPERKWLKWIHLAFEDKDTRVRRAAINGMLAYPDESSIPLLLENMKKLEKKKKNYYTEWVVNRHALETLSGQFHRDKVDDWFQWWDVVNGRFTIKKRVEEEREVEGEDGDKPRTRVVKRGGVEIILKMKVAGVEEGFPLLVLPWTGMEPDYFRPYFHGIEDFMRVYYVQMPQVGDFKGLKRHAASNLVIYPTKILAGALSDLMLESGLKEFAVLGHGPYASTLAIWAAALARENPAIDITHLVLINPRSAGDMYREAMDNVQKEGRRRGSYEIDKGVDSITVKEDGTHVYEPADSAERGGLGRALGNLRYADPTLPEIGAINFLFSLPGGTSTFNDDSWSVKDLIDNRGARMPVLIFAGEKAAWTPLRDILRVKGRFPKSILVKLPNSAEVPFISETYRFTAHMKGFFKRVAKTSEKKKSSGKDDRKNGRTKPKQ